MRNGDETHTTYLAPQDTYYNVLAEPREERGHAKQLTELRYVDGVKLEGGCCVYCPAFAQRADHVELPCCTAFGALPKVDLGHGCPAHACPRLVVPFC